MKTRTKLGLLSVLPPLLLCCIVPSVEGYKDGLYSTDTDFVKPLNHTVFQDQVINSRPSFIWIVEFYNSWCGHCIHFAPTWKKLAEQWKGWSDIIAIAAIDCSQAINMKTCREFDIRAYPTMKMFPPMELPGRLEKVAPIETQALAKIKTSILDFVTEFTPEGWPRLKPLEKMEDLWEEKGVQNAQLFVIFEEETSEIGRQVVLDMRNVTGIQVHTMQKGKVTKFGITEFPCLYRVNPDSTYTKLAVGKNLPADRELFVEHIREELKSVDTAGVLKVNSESKHEDSKAKTGLSMNSNGVLANMHLAQANQSQVNMQDLESALHYSLRQEIAICQTIEGEQLEALKNYLDVLKKYFPGREPVQSFLVKAWEALTDLSSHSLTGEEWMNQLDTLQTEEHYLPEVIRWASCQGSSPQYRGFPCGMWTLFHVLTVEAYVQNRGQRRGYSREVLLAMQGYMKHFFGCEECSKHFLQMAQHISLEVSSHADSVLWLWKRHNEVNKRLHGDRSEDPLFPKKQFPPEALCPTCKASNGLKWDEGKVLSFLTGFYSRSGIFSPADLQTFGKDGAEDVEDDIENVDADTSQSRQLDWWENKQRERDLKQIRELRLRKRNRKSAVGQRKASASADQRFSQRGSPEKLRAGQLRRSIKALWGLTQLDVSMCIVFYIISTAIILLLYHHFIVRRHMNPCKNLKKSSLAL